MGLATEYLDDGSSFIAIDPMSINPDVLADFLLFERFERKDGTKRFRCLLTNMNSISRERLISLLSFRETVYVHQKQGKHYTEYIKNNLEFFLKNDGIDVKKKTHTLVNLSTELIRETFEKNFNRVQDISGVVENVRSLVGRAMDFMSKKESLKGIADLVGHDYETHTHSIKVGWLMATFINSNQDLFEGKTKAQLRKLMVRSTVAGFLHDIGKVKIPKNVINKPGRLNNLEYGIIQAHTAYSLSLLYKTDLPKFCMETILYHHENEDGSGYPCGLAGDLIPLMAKICHITDVFDALTSKRSYKEAKTPMEALSIMAGENPHLEALREFEAEARENRRIPLTVVVRDRARKEVKRLREKEILEQEARKRVEARVKIRDKGMSHCFDKKLLRRFILTIRESESFNLSGVVL